MRKEINDVAVKETSPKSFKNTIMGFFKRTPVIKENTTHISFVISQNSKKRKIARAMRNKVII